MTAELKEKITDKLLAHAIFSHRGTSMNRAYAMDAATSVLSAIEAAGYVVVPREPTLVMLDVAMAIVPRDDAETVWQAMIEAATKG